MKPLGYKMGIVQLGSKVKPSLDYSGIMASLNLLTDTEDTFYDGTNPDITSMDFQLYEINGEIIGQELADIIAWINSLTDSSNTDYDGRIPRRAEVEAYIDNINLEIV
jgi:hypothetical protein